MALKNWTAAELRGLAESLQEASVRIFEVIEKMELTSFPHLVLQADTAVSIHAPVLINLANTMNSEFSDQYNAAKFGRKARWEMNQRKVKVKYEKLGKTPRGHNASPPKVSNPLQEKKAAKKAVKHGK